MTNKIKRNLVKSFLNTNTPASPTWSLLGLGVSSGVMNMNPKTSENTWIHESSASIDVESYAPTMPIEMTCFELDEVFEYLDAYRKTRAVLDDAETEIVNVWLYETPALSYYYAEKIVVSVSIDSFGGDGGESTKMNFTINHIGDPVLGTFNPTALTFFPAPINTILTSMAIETNATLTPLFSADNEWLWYALAVTNGNTSVQMDSVLAGATIVQATDGGTVVGQGSQAALNVGANDLTITVTEGGESVIYTIRVTRAA